MGTASARRRRKHKAISVSSSIFSDCMDNKDYENAAKILYWTSLNVGGKVGILKALNSADSFIKRSKLESDL